MSDPTISTRPSTHYRVQTQKDWFNGNPFPWEDSPLAWVNLEAASEEARSVRARHDQAEAGHTLAVRVVRVTTEVMRMYPDPKGKGAKGERA